MKVKERVLIYCLVYFLSIQLSSCFIANFQTFVSFAMNMGDKAGRTIDSLAGENVTEDYEANMWGDRTQSYLESVVKKVDKISSALEFMHSEIDTKLNVLETMLSEMPDTINQQSLMKDFSVLADRIALAYDTIQIFAWGEDEDGEESELSEDRVKLFIEDNIASQKKAGIEGILSEITTIMISPNNPDNLLAVLERTEKRKYAKTSCGTSLPHIILYEFYLTIAGLELLGFSTLSTGYGLREIIEPERKAAPEIKYIQKRMLERMAKYAQKFSATMTRLYRSHRTCDPPEPERNVTFVEMWGLYGIILLSEYGSLRKGNDRCDRSCAGALNGITPTNRYCHAKPNRYTSVVDGRPEDVLSCTTDRMCYGRLSNCWGYNTIRYCMKPGTSRRYDWITGQDADYTEFRHGTIGRYSCPAKTFGTKNGCEDGLSDSWSAYERGSDYCDYCICMCNDNGPDSISVNTVSLKTQRSNTKENKVIVGVRIVTTDDILQFQIKEAEIKKEYYLSLEPSEWVEVEPMKDEIKKVLKDPEYSSDLTADVDFTVIEKDEHAFNFDELELPFDRILTGVKFGFVQLDEGNYKKRIQIEIESMKYDYKTGKLEQGSEELTKPTDPASHTSKLEFADKSSEFAENQTTRVDSKSEHYVVLKESNLYTDLSQTVLPLFNSQNIGSYPETPLQGLGFHHRTLDGSSGYLALTGYTTKYGEFINDAFKEYYELNDKKDAKRKKASSRRPQKQRKSHLDFD